jgi:hypothetical protein
MTNSVLESSDKEKSYKLSSLDDPEAEEEEQEATIIVQEEEKVLDNDHYIPDQDIDTHLK